MSRKHKDKSQEIKIPQSDEQPVTESKDELTQAKHELESLKTEKEELFGKLQRVSADYANFQKRVSKQIADSIAYEKEVIIKSLLPVLDNFEHTLINAAGAENADSLVKGVQIIYDQLMDILKSQGVEQITASGQKFDPALHEALMQQSEPEQENNIVLKEFQKGYKLNGRVIRPSKVIVNKIVSNNILDENQQDDFETTDYNQ